MLFGGFPWTVEGLRVERYVDVHYSLCKMLGILGRNISPHFKHRWNDRLFFSKSYVENQIRG